MSKKRLGVFAGTFDPVHTGHIAFALQAIDKAKLHEVVFVPERRPRSKRSAEHFGHRVAMIRQAVKPHPKLAVVELVEANLSVSKTLPHLRTTYGNAELVMLVGSDVLPTMAKWPNIDRLLEQTELIVGVREGESPEAMALHIETWPVKPRALYVFTSFAPEVSSSKVREQLSLQQRQRGVLASVVRYARKNWLYIKLPR